MVVALAFTLEREPMQLALLREGDWAGIVTMAIGLSALQTVLEEGNKDDWFGSPFIFELAIVAVVFLSLFVAIELTVDKAAGQSAPAQAAQFRHRRRRQCAAGLRACSARSMSCRNISDRCSVTTPSRSARCWHGPDCRNSC